MSWDEKIVLVFYALLGAAVGILVFFFALGGVGLLAGRATAWWNGWSGFFLCAAFGALAGGFSYKHRNKEIASSQKGIYGGAAGAVLLMRRLGVILFAVVAIYYLWQLGKSI